MKNEKYAALAIIAYNDIYATNKAIHSLGVLNSIIQKICLISGISVLFCCIMRYFAYKKNPIAVKFSQPFWLFIIGLCLLGLAYLPSPMN
jgi:hypothetical protein